MAFEAFFPIGTYSRWIFKFGSWHALLWNLPHFGSGSRPLFESEPFHTEELLILSEKNLKNTGTYIFLKLCKNNGTRRKFLAKIVCFWRTGMVQDQVQPFPPILSYSDFGSVPIHKVGECEFNLNPDPQHWFL